eukprot:s2952_g5.t2
MLALEPLDSHNSGRGEDSEIQIQPTTHRKLYQSDVNICESLQSIGWGDEQRAAARELELLKKAVTRLDSERDEKQRMADERAQEVEDLQSAIQDHKRSLLEAQQALDDLRSTADRQQKHLEQQQGLKRDRSEHVEALRHRSERLKMELTERNNEVTCVLDDLQHMVKENQELHEEVRQLEMSAVTWRWPLPWRSFVYRPGRPGRSVQIWTASRSVNGANGGVESRLLSAIAAGEAAEIQDLLASGGADVNLPDKNGQIAVVAAAISGDSSIVEMLLAADADVDARNAKRCCTFLPRGNGVSAIVAASHLGHYEVVEKLIHARCDVDSVNKAGATALVAAAEGGQMAVVELLLEALTVAANGASALAVAAQLGFANVASSLLQSNAMVDYQNEQVMNASALVQSSQQGHVDAWYNEDVRFTGAKKDMVEVLLAAKASVDLPCSDGATALILASQVGHQAVVSKLLAARADPNRGRNDGGTALMFAAQEGHLKVAKQLLTAGAEATACAASGATAMSLAARNQDKAMLRCLMAAGKDAPFDVTARMADARKQLQQQEMSAQELHALDLERADVARLHEQIRLENREKEVTITRLNNDKDLARRVAGELAAELRRVQGLQDTWHDRAEQYQLDILVMQEQISDINQRVSSCEESQQKALEEDAKLKGDVAAAFNAAQGADRSEAVEAHAVASLRLRRHQIQSALQQTKVEIASQKRSAEQNWSQVSRLQELLDLGQVKLNRCTAELQALQKFQSASSTSPLAIGGEGSQSLTSKLKDLVEQRYAKVGELDAEQQRLKAEVLRLRAAQGT